MSKTQNSKKSRQLIRSFEAKSLRKRSYSGRVVDWLTSYFGSIGFLILNAIIFLAWILINLGLISFIPVFDPYPFVLLITLVSLEAIILTTIVLMSQNRQTQIDTLREELQLQVELITEKEISKVLKLLNELLKHEGVEIKDPELTKMLEAVDASYIERELEKQLTDQSSSFKKDVAEPIVKAGEKMGKSLGKK